MTPIQRDLGPRNPPASLGEDPFLIWFQYGLGDLLYWAGKKFGPEILDEVRPRLDAINYAVMEAVHEAKQRLAPHPPNSFRLDTTDIEPTRGA